MVSVSKIMGLIPARGGSKRLPGKNLIDLGGCPLIHWTILAAVQSKIFDNIVISTDDGKIADYVIRNWDHWCQVRMRPEALAMDASPMAPVLRDAVERYPCDVSILLQPTSPFRTAEDIVAAYDMLIGTGGDAVISVTSPPEDLVFEVGHARRLRPRPEIVVPNGALYLLTDDALQRGISWYSGAAYGYAMPKDRSLDIDTELDLAAARAMLEHLKAA